MRSCVTFNMNTLIYTCVVFPLLTTQQFAMYVRILWLEQENLINNVLFFSFSRMEKVARVSSIMLQKLGTLCCWIFCCNTAPSTFIPERTVDSQPSCQLMDEIITTLCINCRNTGGHWKMLLSMTLQIVRKIW